MKYSSRFWKLSLSQDGEKENVFVNAESKLPHLLWYLHVPENLTLVHNVFPCPSI